MCDETTEIQRKSSTDIQRAQSYELEGKFIRAETLGKCTCPKMLNIQDGWA